MAIFVKCGCGKYYRFDDSHAGKSGNCSQCGAPLTIPDVKREPLKMPVAGERPLAPTTAPAATVAAIETAPPPPKPTMSGLAPVGGGAAVAAPEPVAAAILAPEPAVGVPDSFLLAYSESGEQKLYRLYRSENDLLFLHLGAYHDEIEPEQYGRAGYQAGLVGVGAMALMAGAQALQKKLGEKAFNARVAELDAMTPEARRIEARNKRNIFVLKSNLQTVRFVAFDGYKGEEATDAKGRTRAYLFLKTANTGRLQFSLRDANDLYGAVELMDDALGRERVSVEILLPGTPLRSAPKTNTVLPPLVPIILAVMSLFITITLSIFGKDEARLVLLLVFGSITVAAFVWLYFCLRNWYRE